jgi:hypothetical protein
MQIRKPRSWGLPDSVVTPEADYLRRRDFLRVVGLGVAATAIFPATIRAAMAGFPDTLDPAFKLDGVKLTPYDLIKALWNQSAPDEYGFYANANPEVDHPRWSQKTERVIGGGFFSSKQPTLIFNGYGKEVAALYAGMDLRKNF